MKVRILWFLALILFPALVVAEDTVLPNDRVAILGEGNQLLTPLLKVQADFSLHISETESLKLDGVGRAQAEVMIKEAMKATHSVTQVQFFGKDQLAKITVLGDINEPGSYWVPLSSNLNRVNEYSTLFDSGRFEPSYTLIRNGNRHVVQQGELDQTLMEANDVLLVALKRKKIIPKEVVVEPVKEVEAEPQAEEVVETTEEKTDPVSQATDQIAEALPEAEVEQPKPEIVEEPLPDTEKTTEVVETKKEMDPALDKYNVIGALRNYPLQPGDILRIDLPGEEGFNEDFLINRAGEISLPEVGQLSVVGSTLGETEKLIYQKLSDVYLGLDKLLVTLKEKRLLVTVLGYVEKPGEVELSQHGNVQTAINSAGGLLDGAQLDMLQLRRGDEVIEFNFKRYLDTGDPSITPELKSLDTIFVPSSPELGNVHGEMGGTTGADGMDPTQDRTAIKVFGEVIKPATFPFKEDMSVVDALLRAGGVTRYANVEQIRVIDSGEPTLFDLKGYLDEGDDNKLPVLSKGATIFIPKQVDAVKAGGRIVYVMGQVQKPGAFETGEKVGFLDVLANAGGPNRYADTRMVRILRTNGDVVPFNLQDYAEGEGTELPPIMAGDAIFIPEKGTEIDRTWLKLPTNKSIHMLGAILKPGRYEYSETITFMDLLAHAGGPNNRADLTRIRIVEAGESGEANSREFNLESFLEKGGNWNALPKLSGGSTIVFPELPESPTDNKSNWIKLSSEQSIYIMGSVVAPGRYAFNDQLDLLDILSAAEGPKDEADLTNVRIIHRNGSSPRVSHLNLVNYFETGDETLLPSVSTGDTIYIPSRNRSWVQKKKEETVRILGAVKDSGRYEFDSEMTILDILAEAGGPTKTAYIEKIIIVNASCCKNQAYTFDLMDFMKDPDVSRLPVIRPGDTVYIPDVSRTQFAYFMDALKDTISIVSLISLTKALIGGSAL